MSQRPIPPEPLEALLRAHGLHQPSATFTASLTQLVVAQYVPPRVEPFRARAWLGTTILLVLASLLLVATYAVPVPVSAVLTTSSVAVVLGTGGLIWLLEHDRKRLPTPGLPG